MGGKSAHPEPEGTELSFSRWTGTLTLKTKWMELSLDGVDPKEKASAYLKLRGYPFKD